MNKKLRIQGLTVQVTLVWDDGEELHPGPALQPAQVTLSQIEAFAASLPAEVALLGQQLLDAEATEN